MKHVVVGQGLCANCTQRPGRHRYGTLQCPNPAWKPGNGHHQWLATVFLRRLHSWPGR